MAMILTYPTWQDQSLSSHHNSLGRSSSLSSAPVVRYWQNPKDNTVDIIVDVTHDGRYFEVREKHYVVDAEKDRDYFRRCVPRIVERLRQKIYMDEMERWINLTP
jgi:hypothetical protein